MTRQDKHEFWSKQSRFQRNWYNDHGGCLSAYVERYGSADSPNHFGNGGEAIHQADFNALRHAEHMAAHYI